MSDDLIDRLSRDLKPSPSGQVVTRLATALALGFLASLSGVVAVLGLRPAIAAAPSTPMFWTKLAYTGAIAGVGALCVERLARPSGAAGRRSRWLAGPFLGILAAAALQLAAAPGAEARHLVMGDSAMVCPWFIAATSAPLLVALGWAVRSLAPTRLRLAGAFVGLTAGGFGAFAYSLHCPESGAPFVALWYTLGILAPCAIGAVLGPRLLRW